MRFGKIKLGRPHFLLFLILLVLVTFFFNQDNFSNLTTKFSFTNRIKCYRIATNETLPEMPDKLPSSGSNKSGDALIFFHETSCHSYSNGRITLSGRQACAIESAAVNNPNATVYVLFTSPGKLILNDGSENADILSALLAYKNIKLHYVNYERYTRNTPIEHLYRDGFIESSNYALSHASDVLRYLTLWKYGGIYLDLDVIVLKSLLTLPPNYAGAESNTDVAAGVISFSHDPTGLKLARECLEDLRDNFDGKDWGNNGPGVITRLAQKHCHKKLISQMTNINCSGDFKVYPSNFFYSVPWRNWKMFFKPLNLKIIKQLEKEAYVFHVWNLHSESVKIYTKMKNVPYLEMAKKHCPAVVTALREYF